MMKNLEQACFAMVLAVLCLTPVSAAGTLQELNKQTSATAGQNTIESLGEMEVAEQPEVMRGKCLQAFGHNGFCVCLKRQLSPGTSFESYIKYVTKSKMALRYSQSTVPRRRAIDHALTARDRCSVAAFGPKAKRYK